MSYTKFVLGSTQKVLKDISVMGKLSEGNMLKPWPESPISSRATSSTIDDAAYIRWQTHSTQASMICLIPLSLLLVFSQRCELEMMCTVHDTFQDFTRH